ncbi:peptidoglycan-binding protein, partial [bacterium]|nr:peptidoglycan-binding protein [bacterium]
MRCRLLLSLVLLPVWLSIAQWESSRVWHGSDGRLLYARDGEGNAIPDFSYAGYKNGSVPLPDVAAVTTLGPAPGDNTLRIQAALDAVGARTPD